MYKNFTNYEIFVDGRIWSKYSKKFLKPQTMKNGYQRVCLVDNEGKKHYELLHKVVYFAVNGLWEYPEGMQINHIDEDKSNNNAISNLEMVTPKYNNNWGTHNERMAASKSKRVGAYKNGELIMCFPSTAEAQRNGYSSGAVSACCRNCYMREGNNVYKGFEWRYLDN